MYLLHHMTTIFKTKLAIFISPWEENKKCLSMLEIHTTYFPMLFVPNQYHCMSDVLCINNAD